MTYSVPLNMYLVKKLLWKALHPTLIDVIYSVECSCLCAHVQITIAETCTLFTANISWYLYVLKVKKKKKDYTSPLMSNAIKVATVNCFVLQKRK